MDIQWPVNNHLDEVQAKGWARQNKLCSIIVQLKESSVTHTKDYCEKNGPK
jgi:hypothetical protein